MGNDADDQQVEELEQPEQEQQEEQTEQEQQEEQPSGVKVTFGEQEAEEDADAKASGWVKEVRQRNRQLNKELREARDQLARLQPQPQDEVGKEPELEDFDYDPAKFKQATREWLEKKAKADARKAEQAKAEQDAQAAWNAKLEAYSAAKASLGADDFDDAEEVVQSALNPTQIGIILSGADAPAELILGLGTNQAKLKELASITDPVKFAFAVAALQAKVTKVATTKKPPAPERRVSGNAGVSGTVDSNLDRLRADAEKTGDYSKVTAYKRQLRDKAR